MNTYKNFINERREIIFGTDRRSSPPLVKLAAFSAEIDKLLASAYTTHIEATALDRHICLIALGGYGRSELWPYSDIDILILHSGEANKEKISSAVRFFWDMGLNLGLVVRSLHECSKILGDDIASDTAMLSARFLAGNKRLFNHLESTVTRPYFVKNRRQFAQTMRAIVHNGVFSSDNTLYRTEPNIKDGICALRDCQRIMWAERVIAGSKTIADLYHLSHYSQTDVDSFSAAYEFLARIRTELHWFCKQRIDTLETSLQSDISEALGFGSNQPAMLMEAYFRTVRTVKEFALAFLEKRLPSRGLWSSFRSSVGSLKIREGVYLLDGILFIGTRGLPSDALSPQGILSIFKGAGAYSATLSVELANKIRGAMQTLSAKDFRTETVDALFLEILSQETGASRVISHMHDTGVLAGLIPAFKDLTCKVEYDTNHEFTIDQHILLALFAVDKLDTDEDERIRTVAKSLPDKRLLRIATLLHDIGKAMDGDHVTNGAIIAEEVCDRLGLAEHEKRRVVFLIYNHLALSSLAFSRELEQKVVEELAHHVEDVSLLNMLYLLTVIDIRNVGFKTWTAWRAKLLETAFDRVLSCIGSSDAMERVHPQEIGINSPLYNLDTIPEDRIRHATWLSELSHGDFRVELDSFVGFDQLTILTFDRIGLFADITGCLSSEGYSILSARVYSTADGRILDVFHVEPDGITSLPSIERVKNIQKKWHQITSGKTTASALVAERIRMYPQKKLRELQRKPAVSFDNNASQVFTVLDIEAPDRFGLLYRIARCLSDSHINIVSARLSTRIDQATDMFYITNQNGTKITDAPELATIAGVIEKAIEAD